MASSAPRGTKRKAAQAATLAIRAGLDFERSGELGARGSGSGSGSSSSASAVGGDSSATVTIIPGGVPGYTPDASLYTAAIPTRHPKKNYLVFPDRPEFTPNLTPEQILRAGAFGGTYFRTISSRVTKKRYVDAHREFPAEWFAGLNLKRVITSVTYDVSVNKFGVKCGQDLDAWESSGWITEDAPFGWFHWYCRFYLGRRSWDDDRQISRWVGVAGPKGRWKSNLIAKCVAAGRPHDDASISPVVRQTLLHWAYELNKEDHDAFAKVYKSTGKAPYIPASSSSSAGAGK